MPDLYVEMRDWSLGVLSANEPDLIPDNALMRAHNTAFRAVGQGLAVLGTRPGLAVVDNNAITGTPGALRLVPYNHNNAGTYNEYLAIVSDNGTLRYKDSSEVINAALAPPANYPFSSGTAFTAGSFAVDATVMSNRLFLVNTNGERRSLLGTNYVPFGLSPIATISVAAASGGSSSMPLETYDIQVTSYNSSTGAESSTSTATAVTTAGANDRIQVTITPTAGETAQYTHWRIYLRRQSTQPRAYRVLITEDVGGTQITSNGNIPIATTTAYIDLTATQIANLVLAAPSTTENNPPATSIRFLAAYGRRLIAADRDSIYWSKLDLPDAFPPINTEPVETGEGDEVKGIYQFSAELLLIFTKRSVWGLFGNDPQTWVLRPIDNTRGSVSHLSVVGFDGGVGWWSEGIGPVFFDGTQIIPIALEKLGTSVVDSDENVVVAAGVSQGNLHLINAGVDIGDSRVLWSFPTSGARCDRILPYNYRMKAWEATTWDPLDVAAMGQAHDQDGRLRLYVGGYKGQLFKFNRNIKHDATPSGTRTGTFTATGSSITSFTGTGFSTTGAGLVERYVTITDTDNKPIARRRISANTATTITLAEAVTGLQNGRTYNFYIGGPDFRIYTKWIDGGQPFLRKRFDRVYIQARSSSGSPTLLVSTHIDFIDDDQSADASVRVAGDVWDVGLWDTAIWAGAGALKRRLPILKTSTALRIAVLHFSPGIDVVIDKIAVLARGLSDRYFD